jgi:hypothetical protein
MNDIYIQNKGTTKTLIHENGHNKISKIGWEADYDGTIANIDLDLNNNGHNSQMHFELNNNDLEELLNIPSVKQPLHSRLLRDFKKKSVKKSPLFIVVEEPRSKVKVVEPLLQPNKYTHVSSPLPMEDVLLPLAIKRGRRKTITLKNFSSRKPYSYRVYKRKPSSSSSRKKRTSSYRIKRTSSHR